MTGSVVHVRGEFNYDEYVGRQVSRYELPESILANKYWVGRDGTLSEVLTFYEDDVRESIEKEDEFIIITLLDLRDKTLACWCADRDQRLTVDDKTICHAQIILKLGDELWQDINFLKQ